MLRFGAGPHVLRVQWDDDRSNAIHTLAPGDLDDGRSTVHVWHAPPEPPPPVDAIGFLRRHATVREPLEMLAHLAEGGAGFDLPPMVRSQPDDRCEVLALTGRPTSQVLLPIAQLRSLRRFPRHHEEMLELATSDLVQRLRETNGRLWFVSHVWPSQGEARLPDTPEHDQAAALLSYLERHGGGQGEDEGYLWVDCSCIEEGGGALHSAQMLALPVYLRCATDFIALTTPDYWQTAHCRFELANFCAEPTAERVLLDVRSGVAETVSGRDAGKERAAATEDLVQAIESLSMDGDDGAAAGAYTQRLRWSRSWLSLC